MSFNDRLLSCEDDEFVLKVDKDIRDYLENCSKNRRVFFCKLKVKFSYLCNESMNAERDFARYRFKWAFARRLIAYKLWESLCMSQT